MTYRSFLNPKILKSISMKFKYQLDEKLPAFPLIMYGLQWFIVSIPMVLILGAIVSTVHGFTGSDQTFYIQKLLAVVGGGLIIQLLFGHRLPIVMGPATVLLIGIVASGSNSIGEIYTAVFIGGLFIFIMYVSRLLHLLQAVFTPRIVVVIMALIAFTLAPVILNLIFSNDSPLFSLLFALTMVLIMTIANRLLKGVWNSTVVILGLVVGSLVYFANFGFPENIMHTEQGEITTPFLNFPFEFNFGVILSFVFCYIALLINEIGSIQSVGQVLKADNMAQRNDRGVGITGLLNASSGLMGVMGPVDYSMSLGLINATGCASRYALLPAGVLMVACAFLPSMISLFEGLPHLVMGGIMFYLMGSQLAAALQTISFDKLVKDFNDGIVIGVPLMIALLISFLPEEVKESIPALIRPILGNGFVMGVVFVLILEHLVNRKPKNIK